MNLKEKIINFFEKKPIKFYRIKMILEELEIEKDERIYAQQILNELHTINYLLKKRDAFSKNGKLKFAIGIISTIKGGSAFLIDKEKIGKDIFIPSSQISNAYDKDLVLCLISKNYEGKVVYVIERGKKRIAGIVSDGYLFPFSSLEPIRVSTLERNKVGVIKELSESNVSDVEIIGDPLDIETIIKTVEVQFDLRKDFEKNVLKECDSLKMEEDFSSRRDLRNLSTITIDPIDAKDFDDAISVILEKNGNFRIFVHIADVSHFVKEGSHIDIEARRRGNSVYLPTTVYPMLPNKLSNDLCSLNENEDKLCISVEISIDKDGNIKKSNFYESVINSKKRVTYEEAEEVIDGNDIYREDVLRTIRDGYKIAKIVNEKRYSRGALDFDLEKPYLIMNEGKYVESVFPEVRLKSHKLIEEFMLIANEEVAKYLSKNKVPFIYRIHEEPDAQKLEKLKLILSPFNLGFNFKKGTISPIDLQIAIERAKCKPYERLVSYLILRTMMRARYSEREGSHFGLALRRYCHFTSPIRRYADLVVHRALKRCLKGITQPLKGLKEIALNCTKMEELSDEAERESVNWLILNYLKNRVGDDFKVIITGFTKFGMRVELINELIEGVIPFNTMNQDNFIVDPKGFSAKGKYTSQTFRIGQIIDAKLIKLDIFNKEPQFKVI